MSKELPSTSFAAVQALQDDAEVQRLIRRVGRRYPEHAPGLIQDLIVQSFSTSVLTTELGSARPGGMEFFKAELRVLADDDTKDG